MHAREDTVVEVAIGGGHARFQMVAGASSIVAWHGLLWKGSTQSPAAFGASLGQLGGGLLTSVEAR